MVFVLARDVAHNVGLGVPELGLCKGLTELLRAFNREFGAVEVLTDRPVGPKRPAKNYASEYLVKTYRKTFFTKVPIEKKQTNPHKAAPACISQTNFNIKPAVHLVHRAHQECFFLNWASYIQGELEHLLCPSTGP